MRGLLGRGARVSGTLTTRHGLVHAIWTRDEDDGYITACRRNYMHTLRDEPDRTVTCVQCVVRTLASTR